jgi:hypothetical protein
MNFRNDTYIGTYHYWIRFYNGTHEVRRAEPDNPKNDEDIEIETVFTGHYEDCVKYIRDIEIEYLESTLF